MLKGSDLEKLVDCFKFLSGTELIRTDDRVVCLEVLADSIIEQTIVNYDCVAEQYKDTWFEMDVFTAGVWENLLYELSNYPIDTPRVLEVGAGCGRDLIYGQSKGLEMYGLERSNTFYQMLMALYNNKTIHKKPILSDFRMLPFPDCEFDVVRHNATLHHIPLTGSGGSFDRCISESHRVLKPKGLIQILTKQGNELVIIDTVQQMGQRVFQLLEEKELIPILEEHNFCILSSQKKMEHRTNGTSVDWIEIIARRER